MKRVYISCYENNDRFYKNTIVNFNRNRNETLFKLIDSNESSFNEIQKGNPYFIELVKQLILKDSEVTIFLIGEETKKRKIVDWEARATMLQNGFLKKSGIIIIYLPDIVEKYGTKIPRSVLPTILQKNLQKPDVFAIETTWEKISKDFFNLEKLISVAYAYAKISEYELDDEYKKENSHNMNI
ncbi:TIR domain-containing protein [Malacoplasma iowae]|uniref:TIR domain-containing protein n=1 Tax=Malacoplasma iowae TaxID=2116 RepID=UPI003873B195|nr:TIR domain-containing protein [Malacoplasma iowae]